MAWSGGPLSKDTLQWFVRAIGRRPQLRMDPSDFCGPEDAIARALACPGKPIVVSDGADATNSGAGGDSTHLLRAMIDQEIPEGALTIMVDGKAVAHAESVGAGGVFEFAVGGKRDNAFSQPLMVRGKVASLQPARYVLCGHLGNKLPIDMGLSATVRIGDVTLLLVEHPGPGSSPMMYRCVGLEPKDFKIVIVKSPVGFRAEFEPFAASTFSLTVPAAPRLISRGCRLRESTGPCGLWTKSPSGARSNGRLRRRVNGMGEMKASVDFLKCMRGNYWGVSK